MHITNCIIRIKKKCKSSGLKQSNQRFTKPKQTVNILLYNVFSFSRNGFNGAVNVEYRYDKPKKTPSSSPKLKKKHHVFHHT